MRSSPTKTHEQQQPPPIQAAPSAGSMSLSYSIDESFTMPATTTSYSYSGARNNAHVPLANNNNGGGGGAPQIPPAYELQRSERIPGSMPKDGQSMTEDSIDYSSYSAYSEDMSGMSGGQYNQYQQEGGQHYLPTVNEYGLPVVDDGMASSTPDATETIHEMHRQLLYLLSHAELFHDALEWQWKLDRGIDPTVPHASGDNAENGIQAFDHEFEDEETDEIQNDKQQQQGGGRGAREEKQSEGGDDETNGKNNSRKHFKSSKGASGITPAPIRPPLPHLIFAPDAEVVLPEALTASQLFGIERVTGIELEAAAGIGGLSQLFLRWLGERTFCSFLRSTLCLIVCMCFHW